MGKCALAGENTTIYVVTIFSARKSYIKYRTVIPKINLEKAVYSRLQRV